MEFRVGAEGLSFPEAPVALPDGSVLVAEIAAGRVSRVADDGSKSLVAAPGGGPNGLALGPGGKLYLCNNGGMRFREDAAGMLHPGGTPADYGGGGIERIDLNTGAVELLYASAGEHPLRGPNDIVFDRSGGFWFTDFGKIRRRVVDRGGVYYGTADGAPLKEVLQPLSRPNGIGLSPQQDRLYVAETETGRLWAFDIAGPGEIRRRPLPSPNGGELVVGLAGYQLFDSLAVDSEGNICVATIGNPGITVVSPDGKRVEHIPLPDPYVTNLCFGGPELRTAFVTLSGSGRLIALAWPRPGLRLNFC